MAQEMNLPTDAVPIFAMIKLTVDMKIYQTAFAIGLIRELLKVNL